MNYRKSLLGINKLFFQYLLSYCIVLLVPLSLGSYAFIRTSKELEQQIIEDTTTNLSYRVSLLDQRLQELDDFINQLTLDSRVNKYLSYPSPMEDGASLWAVYELQSILAPYRLGNTFASTFHLNFETSNTVITPHYSFIDMRYFYNHYFAYSGMSSEEWFSRMFDSFHQKEFLPSHEVDFGSSVQRVLTLIQSLPLSRSAMNRGVLIVFIPEENFFYHLRHSVNEDDHIIVRDTYGRILASTDQGFEAEIPDLLSDINPSSYSEVNREGETRAVFRVVSESNAWEYFVISPKNVVFLNMRVTRRTLWTILTAAFVLGLVIAYVMANRTSLPISSLVDLLKVQTPQHKPTEKPLEYIKDSIGTLIERDRKLQQTLTGQRPLLQATFIERLLNGLFDSTAEIESYRKGVGLDPLVGLKTVVIFRWNLGRQPDHPHHGLLQMRMALIRRNIVDVFGSSGTYFYDIDFQRIAIIIASDQKHGDRIEPFKDKINQAVSKILRDMKEPLADEQLVVGIGLPTEDLQKIAESANQAHMAAEYMPLTSDDPTVWYAEIPDAGSAYYPTETASELMREVRAGNVTRVREISSEIYQMNFTDAALPHMELEQLKYDMRDTMQKLVARQELSQKPEDISLARNYVSSFDNAAAIDDMFQFYNNVLELLANDAEDSKKSHNTRLRDAVVDYIQENFDDPDLYLPSVAAKFGITKEYLSQFFKEQTGSNFSTYLENQRVQKATDLLRRDQNSIQEVAMRCGYRSPQVFRRAFKRVLGTTPREYQAQS